MAPTRRGSRLDRARTVLVAGLVVGFFAYLVTLLHALTVGGLTVTSQLATCAEAATGRYTTAYRLGEDLTIDHGFLPPTAVCRWSGGSSAALVAGRWTWSGVVLGGAALLGLVVLRVHAARTRAGGAGGTPS